MASAIRVETGVSSLNDMKITVLFPLTQKGRGRGETPLNLRHKGPEGLSPFSTLKRSPSNHAAQEAARHRFGLAQPQPGGRH